MDADAVIHQNGDFWVAKIKSKNPQIAPVGSIYYQTFWVNGVASYSHGKPGLPFYTADQARAVQHCDYMAKENQ